MTAIQIVGIVILAAWAVGIIAVCLFTHGGKQSEWTLPPSDFDDRDEAGGGRP